MTFYEAFNTPFIDLTCISHAISFFFGFFLCAYRISKKIKARQDAENAKTASAPILQKISPDPMIFEFHLVESGDYILHVNGMEGRHLVKENHKKFTEMLKFICENEKLRPFPKAHQFKLLTFEKKDET